MLVVGVKGLLCEVTLWLYCVKRKISRTNKVVAATNLFKSLLANPLRHGLF